MKTPSQLSTATRGFTLVELLVVISIIGILASILLPALAKSKKRAQVAIARTDMKNVVSAVHSYKADYGRLPATTGTVSAYALGAAGRDCTYGTSGLTSVPYTSNGGSALALLNGGGGYETNNSAVIAAIGDFVATPAGATTINANHALNVRQARYFDGKMTSGIDGSPTAVVTAGVNADLVYRDPWNMPYFITLDTSGDGYCFDAFYRLQAVSRYTGPIPPPGQVGPNGMFNSVDPAGAGNNFAVREEVIVWSAGPDTFANPAVSGDPRPTTETVNTDNVLSWSTP